MKLLSRKKMKWPGRSPVNKLPAPKTKLRLSLAKKLIQKLPQQPRVAKMPKKAQQSRTIPILPKT